MKTGNRMIVQIEVEEDRCFARLSCGHRFPDSFSLWQQPFVGRYLLCGSCRLEGLEKAAWERRQEALTV